MGSAFTVLTWNVNSIRSRLDHVLTYLADHEPDIVCLQETKVEDRLFPRVPFMELGYTVNVHGGRALCGVATMTKEPPQEVIRGFREGPAEPHPRILDVVVRGMRVYNVYAPNGTQVGSDAFTYKLQWFRRLGEELRRHCSPTEPILVVGDFNVAPDERDLYDPPAFEGRLHFTDDEHRALADLLSFGLVDCFRKHHPEGGHYTWFDYRTGGFTRNEGMRIDHVYATPPLADRCTEVVHDHEPRAWDTPSDHVPVLARFD